MKRVLHSVWLALALCLPCWGAESSVEIELVMEPGFPLEGRQNWFNIMQGVPNASLRMASALGGERESVENRGTDQSPRYRVVGVLTRRNRLRLPGGEFSLQDRERIVQWFEQLRAEGIPLPAQDRAAFGLTHEQLVEFHDRLIPPLAFPTKGSRAGDVARRIVRELGVPFEVTPEATRAFGRNEAVQDELQGISAGTALAAVLRPLGLVAAPHRARSGDVQLIIADVSQLEEFWPVGWPSEEAPFRTAPALFERLSVEITDTPLSEAIEAIQTRVNVPFLLDHNALARLRVDLDEAKVDFPRGNAAYKRILDRLLFQHRLTSELRLDEAGHPFLWITSTAGNRERETEN